MVRDAPFASANSARQVPANSDIIASHDIIDNIEQ